MIFSLFRRESSNSDTIASSHCRSLLFLFRFIDLSTKMFYSMQFIAPHGKKYFSDKPDPTRTRIAYLMFPNWPSTFEFSSMKNIFSRSTQLFFGSQKFQETYTQIHDKIPGDGFTIAKLMTAQKSISWPYIVLTKTNNFNESGKRTTS